MEWVKNILFYLGGLLILPIVIMGCWYISLCFIHKNKTTRFEEELGNIFVDTKHKILFGIMLGLALFYIVFLIFK